MKVPKYILKKIKQRYQHQARANVLNYEITTWLEKNKIQINDDTCISYCGIGLYTEPETAMQILLELLQQCEDKGEQHESQ